MARTANVFARVEPEVKEQAEQVLDRLGIPMSNAVGMFLRQIVLQRGIPFEMKLPAYEEPVAYGSLTKEQFDEEIEKGMEDIKAGRGYFSNILCSCANALLPPRISSMLSVLHSLPAL